MNEAPPSLGLVGGKYQLVRMIGKGGMGSVWEARHVTLGTSSAIKFIEAEHANSAEARSRFDKEAKAAATIQSKHAIQIFDHGVTEDGKPYIVMELLLGEPLDRYIERQLLGLPETAHILQQVCRGLARAHERGIVHRDLKPENIFLVRGPDDDETVAKVLDFGIAKIASSAGTSGAGISSATKTGAVLGTPFYMSPEQARGLRNVDHRADVWSLGVIAFKCLTGKLPFDGESIGDLLVKICTSPVPVPSHLHPGIPPAFDAWFARALDREPERRFGSVTEMSDALCHIAGIPTRGHGQTPVHFGTTPGHGGPRMTTPISAAHRPLTPSPYAPPPGAMTNAPFTSESIPGVAPHRGRLIATVMIASLVLGCLLALLYVRVHEPGKKVATTANVSPSSPSETSSPLAPVSVAVAATLPPPLPSASAEKHADKPAGTHEKHTRPGAGAPGGPAAPPALPPPGQPSPGQPAPFALPPIPGSAAPVVTPPNKPDKTNPGY